MNIESATLPKRTANRTGKPKGPNPFIAHIQTREGCATTVNAKEVGSVLYMLRDGAASVGMGVRIVLMDGESKVEPKEVRENYADATPIRVLFQGQDARVRRTKAQMEADAAASE
jgi:hypothetical protein